MYKIDWRVELWRAFMALVALVLCVFSTLYFKSERDKPHDLTWKVSHLSGAIGVGILGGLLTAYPVQVLAALKKLKWRLFSEDTPAGRTFLLTLGIPLAYAARSAFWGSVFYAVFFGLLILFFGAIAVAAFMLLGEDAIFHSPLVFLIFPVLLLCGFVALVGAQGFLEHLLYEPTEEVETKVLRGSDGKKKSGS